MLVTHQEGCAPHGSQRADAASARPHRLPEPGGRAPRRPALRPPLGAPAPAPAPGRGALSSLQHPREDSRARWGPHRRPFPWPSELPWGLNPAAGCRTRQSQVPSSQSRSPSRPRAPVIFPFPPLTGRSRSQRFLPRRPAPRAPCWPLCSRAASPARRSAPAAGLNLPTWNLGTARPFSLANQRENKCKAPSGGPCSTLFEMLILCFPLPASSCLLTHFSLPGCAF